MATGNAKRFVELGMAPPQAIELAKQITASTGNVRRLVELGFQPGEARRIVAILAGTTISNNRMTETGLIPRWLRELRSQIGSGPTPVAAPGYLAAVSSPQYSSYGPQRLNTAYSGPLMKLQRSSDNATLDISPISGGDYPSYAAIRTWAGGNIAYVTTLYDQSGNGRHATQSTLANMPVFDLTNAVEGQVVPITFDGNTQTGNIGADPAPVLKKLFVATGGGINLQTHSSFVNLETLAATAQTNYYTFFSDAAGTTQSEAVFGSSGAMSFRTQGGATGSANPATTGYAPKSVKNTFGATVSPTATRIFVNGTLVNSSRAVASVDMGGFALGTAFLTSDNAGAFKLYGAVTYAATLSDADANAVVASFNTAYAVPAAYDYRMVMDTDSIMFGIGAVQFLRSMVNQLRPQLTKRADIINLGIPGQTLANSYAARATRHAYTYTSAIPSVIFLEGATNDIQQASSDTTGTGTDLYTTVTTPFVSYLKGLGFKVVVCTALPRTGFSGTYKESMRTSYNANVIANAAGADYILDIASHPVVGLATAINDNTLYQDGIHLTALGYSYLAGAAGASNLNYKYALGQVLGIVP